MKPVGGCGGGGGGGGGTGHQRLHHSPSAAVKRSSNPSPMRGALLGGVASAALIILTALCLGFFPPTELRRLSLSATASCGPRAIRAPVAVAASGNNNNNNNSSLLSRCPPKRRTEPLVIVYNRVPKTGSSSLMHAFVKIALSNQFSLVNPQPFYNHTAALEAISAAIVAGQKSLIVNHFRFPEVAYGFVGGGDGGDIGEDGVANQNNNNQLIAYINMIRDPVTQCISNYYYTRHGQGREDENAKVIEERGDLPIEQCLDKGPNDPCLECQSVSQVMMFCGREGGRCETMGDRERAEAAWANAVRRYDVVGTTSDLLGFARYLEQLYPSFFRGLVAAVPPKPANSVAYPPVSDAVRFKLKGRLSPDEVWFYDRVAARYAAMKEDKTCFMN